MGADRLVFGGSCGPRASSPRYEMVGSSGIKCSSLKDELGIGSHDLVTSKDPCQSSLPLSGGKGGSILNGGRTRSLHDRWSS
jgi:hypothetical protein